MRIYLVALHGGSSLPLFLFYTTFPPILLSPPSTQQVTSCSLFVVRSVLKSGQQFLTPLLRVSITSFQRHIIFSFPGIVCNSATFPAHAHDIFPHSPNFDAKFLFTGLDDALKRLEQVEQSLVRAVHRFGDTRDTSGNESDMGEPRRRLLSKTTYKMKKTRGLVMLGSFL